MEGEKFKKILNINESDNMQMHIGSYYPVYPLDKEDPESFQANIYNYLYKKNINQKNTNYPAYIFKENDNIETKKREFLLKANLYEIDNEGYLCYKKPDSFSDS